MNSLVLIVWLLVLVGAGVLGMSLNAIDENYEGQRSKQSKEIDHHQSHHRMRHHHAKNATLWTIREHMLQSDGNSVENEKIKHKDERNENDAKKKNCAKCSREIRMSEKELTELRIEYVKNQILKKLRLTERPQVSASNIPKPVADGATFYQDNAPEYFNRAPDEFYGKTTQRLIFPKLGEQTHFLLFHPIRSFGL